MINTIVPTKSQSLLRNLKALWKHIPPKRRIQGIILLCLMIIGSFVEMVSIGAVLPFLGALTAPDVIFDHPLAKPSIQLLGLTQASQILLPATIFFVLAALFAGAFRLALSYVVTRFSYTLGADMSVEMYRRSLHQPYPFHTAQNSAEMIATITQKSGAVIIGILFPLMTLASSTLFLVGIFSTLIAINPIVACSAALFFAVIYGLILKVTKTTLHKNGTLIAVESAQVIKSLQEGFGGIRDVIIDGAQETYSQAYRDSYRRLRIADGRNVFIGNSPRYIVETAGMVLIAVLAYVTSTTNGGIIASIPALGAMALGAQRLLPVVQQVYGSVSSLRGNEASLHDALLMLNQPLPSYTALETNPLLLTTRLELKKAGFRYAGSAAPVLENIDLLICKGQRVGIIGETGSGKSTLLDILMGLLLSTEGGLFVDGKKITANNQRAWQKNMAHVPQAIFLSDSSIAENIAFGIAKNYIDVDRMRWAAELAQISDTIEGLPDKYHTKVGERGARLSGGQRQRIGIARAFYKHASVLIFDEATSALDNETEARVMDAALELEGEITMLVVAHRLSTLKSCDLVVELSQGHVKRFGTYAEMIGNNG